MRRLKISSQYKGGGGLNYIDKIAQESLGDKIESRSDSLHRYRHGTKHRNKNWFIRRAHRSNQSRK